jgi:hypothetical protein
LLLSRLLELVADSLLLGRLLELAAKSLLLGRLLELAAANTLLLSRLLELAHSWLLNWLLLELVDWLLLANSLRTDKLVQLLDLVRGQLLSINVIVHNVVNSWSTLTRNRNKLVAVIGHLEAIRVIGAGQHTSANSF